MSGVQHGRGRAWPLMILGAAFATGLSACSSGGPSVFQQIGREALAGVSGQAPQTPARVMTRADLDRMRSPVIAVSSGGGPRAYLVPRADNGGYIDYRDAAENSVVMLGGAIAEYETPGYDLDGVLYGRHDPIAHPTPLAHWPAQLWRVYQYSLRHTRTYVISLDCIFEPGAPETIDIVERSYRVTPVRETCTNAKRQVVNTYWVDAKTGFIWKSEQWLGPHIGSVTVEIIQPYKG